MPRGSVEENDNETKVIWRMTYRYGNIDNLKMRRFLSTK